MSESTPTSLNLLITSCLKIKGNLARQLATHPDLKVKDTRDAHAVCNALRSDLVTSTSQTTCSPTAIESLAKKFIGVTIHAPHQVLHSQGMSLLAQHFDRLIDSPAAQDSELLTMLDVFCRYNFHGGVHRLVNAIRKPVASNSYQWCKLFAHFSGDHPQRFLLLDRLKKPLPVGLIAVAYADFVNAIFIEGRIGSHPFDTTAGTSKLFEWLIDENPARMSLAQTATRTIPFIQSPKREQYLLKAFSHPNINVQFEAAWASAYLNQREGVERLAAFAKDVKYHQLAKRALIDLGYEKFVPDDSKDQQFIAQSQLCEWLSMPHEFGRPPDAMKLLDTRKLHWPATNDQRDLWLFQFRYQFINDETSPELPNSQIQQQTQEYVGISGSIPFTLYRQVNPSMEIEDIYAWYCCWELNHRKDKRTPSSFSVNAGRKLLGFPLVEESSTEESTSQLPISEESTDTTTNSVSESELPS